MDIMAQFTLLAQYNRTQNKALYHSCSLLSGEQRKQAVGLFFNSIEQTLNHIFVGDILWLRRFNQTIENPETCEYLNVLPQINRLDQLVFTQFDELHNQRDKMDTSLYHFVTTMTALQCQSNCHYHNTQGVSFTKPLNALLLHLFNHQTHHRGQINAALTQLGVICAPSDLLLLIDDIDIP